MLLVVAALLLFVAACSQPEPGGDSSPPPDGTPNEDPTVSGSITEWGHGTGAIEVSVRGPFFFPTGGGIVTTLAASEIADDGNDSYN